MGSDRSEELRASVARAFECFTEPPRCTASARELAVIERAQPLHIEIERALEPARLALAAYSWGSGPAVVLLHGWGGRTAQLAAFVAPLVERGLRVVAADAPAHGDSPGMRSNVLEFVQLLNGLAERCGPLHGAIGHSLGGAAIVMALERGLQAGRVALVAPTARLLDELERFELAAGIGELLHGELESHARTQLGADIWERTRLLHIAPRVAAEVLVVHDEHDPDVPFEASVALAAALPNGHLHATRGLGHLAPLRTRAVVERVVAHLTSEPRD